MEMYVNYAETQETEEQNYAMIWAFALPLGGGPANLLHTTLTLARVLLRCTSTFS